MYSFWDVEINNKIIDNNSDKLAVLLPGINYSTDRVLIDYSKRLVLEMGYDAISIDYGFQIAKKKLNKDKEMNILLEESKNVLLEAIKDIDKKYNEVLFIGKSIGTVVQIYIASKISDKKINNIYLTPIEKTYEMEMSKSLVITGTNDSWISNETVEKIKAIKDIKIEIIEGANHSLNIDGDIIKTARNLEKIMQCEKDYIFDL